MNEKTSENPHTPDHIVEWRDVRKSFGDNRVLNGVTLGVKRGATLVIIGQSGSGKSVLVKTLLGLVAPEGGEVLVEGRNILGNRHAMDAGLKLIGMVFQNSALFDSMNVAENLALPYWESTDWTRERIMRRVTELLGMVGLRNIEHLMPSELSGGMKKRVGLARALADEPEIIIYDEPTTGLDPIMADAINQLIRRIQNEVHVTSIVITHDLSTVRHTADHVALLHGGRIVFYGTADELFASDNEHVRRFVSGTFETEYV
jgi:phospholipid/cholesterol/gamma-HCH transport system ATP-binding protein